ncbi:zinc finger protein 284-like [Ochlerotatus camptorhynchus]|uniref:zinc finger protein 284-like n=1 Tax=Ochlerotatus camptorhynchus TaxID=644619 RepID=UPI0031E07E45
MVSGNNVFGSSTSQSDETERIKCWICPAKFFDSEQRYQDHTEKIHQGFRFRCEECTDEVLFVDIADARNHVDDKHDINLQKCPMCECSFNEFNLREHLTEVHGETRRYKCSLCDDGKRFDDRDSYERHIHDQHQGFRVKCPICHRMLKSKLKPHIEYIHSEGMPKCYICSKEYSNKYKLMRHMKCHTDPIEPGATVRCERCDETFESVAKLNYHKAKHQTKIFQCDKCSKMFYRNAALVQHQKVHEERRGELCCEICSRTFSTGSAYRKHMEIHENFKESGEQQPESEHQYENSGVISEDNDELQTPVDSHLSEHK